MHGFAVLPRIGRTFPGPPVEVVISYLSDQKTPCNLW